ncbi:hypothetical protein RND71_002167 [Anisodus tanguticus]|uniref:Uncharacterized protein n=1 Tax=Anisodus tanguticus TaxID=243964 RepID=A0AAE1VYW6_9SOLA|nr:hypothetical protein RND71_002167 [Anisodus tanguticus]
MLLYLLVGYLKCGKNVRVGSPTGSCHIPDFLYVYIVLLVMCNLEKIDSG